MSSHSTFGIYDNPFDDVYMACGGAVGVLVLVGVVVNYLLGNSIMNSELLAYTFGVAVTHSSIAATGLIFRKAGLVRTGEMDEQQ